MVAIDFSMVHVIFGLSYVINEMIKTQYVRFVQYISILFKSAYVK